jgi:hypothetical protein
MPDILGEKGLMAKSAGRIQEIEGYPVSLEGTTKKGYVQPLETRSVEIWTKF